MLGIPLERLAVEEGGAFGAALLAGVAGGEYASVAEATEAAVRVRETVEPDPAWTRAYDEGYTRFRAAYPAVRPLSAPADAASP